jgi:pimeloyl-ACP methyl ester carboxylesterase
MDVEVNGIRIHYTLEGDGQPVVLLHGYQLDRTFWEPQVRALRSRYRVVVPDLRGFGETPHGDVPVNGPELMAEDVRALLDHLAIAEPVVLGGLSMGGYVALTFVRKYPELVRALLLLDTRGGADTEQTRAGRLAIAEQVEREHSTQPAQAALYPNLMAPAAYDRPELVAHVRAMAARPTPAAIAATLRGMAARSSAADLLPAVRCPTLVVVGEYDTLTPPAEARAIHAAIPGAELVEIPAAGHLSTLEDPTAVNRAIQTFLDRHGI